MRKVRNKRIVGDMKDGEEGNACLCEGGGGQEGGLLDDCRIKDAQKEPHRASADTGGDEMMNAPTSGVKAHVTPAKCLTLGADARAD